jgi:hypothetical protein
MLSFAGEGNPRSAIKKQIAATATRPFSLKREQQSKLDEQALKEGERKHYFKEKVTDLLRTLADLKKQVSATGRSDEDIMNKIGETIQMVKSVAGKVEQLQDSHSKLRAQSLKQMFLEEHHENVIQSLHETSKSLVDDLFRTGEGKEFWEEADVYENEVEEKDALIETHMEDQMNATEDALVDKVSMIVRKDLGPAASPRRAGFIDDDTTSEVSEDQQHETEKGPLDLDHTVRDLVGPSQAPKRSALERRDTIRTEASEVPTEISEPKVKKSKKSKKQREKERRDKKKALTNFGPASAGSSTGTTGSSAGAQSTQSSNTSELKVKDQDTVPPNEASQPPHSEEARPMRDDHTSAPSLPAASASSKSSGSLVLRQESATRLFDNETIEGRQIDDAFQDPTSKAAFEESLMQYAAPPIPETFSLTHWYTTMEKEPPLAGSQPPSLPSSLAASAPSSAGVSLSPRSPAKPLSHELWSVPASAMSQDSNHSHKIDGEVAPERPTQTSAQSAADSRGADNDDKPKAVEQSPEPFEETSDRKSSVQTQEASSIAGDEDTGDLNPSDQTPEAFPIAGDEETSDPNSSGKTQGASSIAGEVEASDLSRPDKTQDVSSITGDQETIDLKPSVEIQGASSVAGDEEGSNLNSSDKAQGTSLVARDKEAKPCSVNEVKFPDPETTEAPVPHMTDAATGHNEDSEPTRPIISPVVDDGEKSDFSILSIIKSQITPWRDLLYCLWVMFIAEPFLINMDLMIELRAWLRWYILGRQSPWTPHAKKRIGMDLRSVTVVLLHCFIMLTIQVWVATTRERQIWMMANLRTRDYLISRVYEDPSLAFLPGVDPHLMLGTPAASAVVMGAWHLLEDVVLPKLGEFQVEFVASVMPIFLWV